MTVILWGIRNSLILQDTAVISLLLIRCRSTIRDCVPGTSICMTVGADFVTGDIAVFVDAALAGTIGSTGCCTTRRHLVRRPGKEEWARVVQVTILAHADRHGLLTRRANAIFTHLVFLARRRRTPEQCRTIPGVILNRHCCAILPECRPHS